MKPGENTRKCTVTRACSSFYGACGVQAARPAGGSHGHRVTVSRDYPGVDGHGVYYSPTRMPLPLTRLPSRPACQCARGQGLAVAAEPDWAGPLSDHSGLDSVSDPPASHHDYNLTSSGDCYHSGSESGRHDDCQHERPSDPQTAPVPVSLSTRDSPGSTHLAARDSEVTVPESAGSESGSGSSESQA
eukprot:510061-Rhodomonas_salina.1